MKIATAYRKVRHALDKNQLVSDRRNHRFPRLVKKVKTHVGFVRTFIQSPRQIGSICPSSKDLALGMINAIPEGRNGVVIDLGSGTGIVTDHLKCCGVDPSCIIAVECCEEFANRIKHNHPDVLVLSEDARNLEKTLNNYSPNVPVRAIISSLPFRAFPNSLARDIASQIKKVLELRGGILIQFSYAWWIKYPLAEFGFQPRQRFFIMKNVPPAIVEVYTVSQH